MRVLPLLGALTLSLAPAGPAVAAFSGDDQYRLGEMASVCGLYHQDQYKLSVVRHWARLSNQNNEGSDVLRLARGMHRAWVRDRDPDAKEIRRDFLACYDTIIRVLR